MNFTDLSDLRYLLNNKYLTLRNLIYSVSIILVIALGVTGYIFYTKNYDQKAYQLFSESLIEYQKAIESGNQEDFINAQRAFELAYNSYSRSSISPFVLAYQSECLLRSGDQNKALELMQKSVDSINSNYPVYYLYLTKLALMQLDSIQESDSTKGLELLEKLAKTFNNPYRDMAGYYLGYQFWVKGDFDQAKKSWNILNQADQDSIWAALASSKMQLIN